MLTLRRFLFATAAILLSIAIQSHAQEVNGHKCVSGCGGGNRPSRDNSVPRNLPKDAMDIEIDRQFKHYQHAWDRDHATIRSVNDIIKKSQNEIEKGKCSQAIETLGKAQRLLDLDDLYPNFSPRNYYDNLYTYMRTRKQQTQQTVQNEMASARTTCSLNASVAQPVLAGPQTRIGSVAGTRIGTAAAIHGEVYRVVGNRQEPITSGMTVSLYDNIITGPNGHMQIQLLDETVFTIGPESDMVLDEFVYDPNTSAGVVTARITKGIFRFVTGKVARKDPAHMKVNLPVGTIGVRGTDLSLKYEPGAEGYIKLARGELEITPISGASFFMEPGQEAVIRADGTIAPHNASRTMKIGRQFH
ncbi:MAG: FecR family protein [Terracidiphilus sp.]|jgi:hypothetical protein